MKTSTFFVAGMSLAFALACGGEPVPETVQVTGEVAEAAPVQAAAPPTKSRRQGRSRGGMPNAQVAGAIEGIQVQDGVIVDVLPSSSGGVSPAVVYVHGGGWSTGRRTMDGWLHERLVAEGYTVVTVDYRLAPEHPYPAGVDDVRDTVDWLVDNAGKYSVDPKRIAVLGPSAGGHLAMMAGLHDESKVAAVVSLFGPSDLSLPEYKESHPKMWDFLQSTPPAEASPINLVSKGDPPVLMQLGTEDAKIPVRDNEAMDKALRAAGVDTTLTLYQGAPHGLHNDPTYQEQSVTEVLGFLAKHLDG